MKDQFRNLDSSLPQTVQITFTRELIHDETHGRPDENDDGFWPSKDKDAAGYVDPDKFDSEMRKAKRRMTAWENDRWHYVGVVAHALVLVPIGGTSFARYEFNSPGLWGIESDAGEYLNEVYEEERGELIKHLATMGAAFAKLAE